LEYDTTEARWHLLQSRRLALTKPETKPEPVEKRILELSQSSGGET
jgi:hypothetical protein